LCRLNYTSENNIVEDLDEKTKQGDNLNTLKNTEQNEIDLYDLESTQESLETSSKYLSNLVFDYTVVDLYSELLNVYMNSNNLGALKTDSESISEFYGAVKEKECKDFEGNFDVESSFMYSFGAAISKAAQQESFHGVGEPDTEKIIEDILEHQNPQYYMNRKTLAMKKGAYDWENFLEKKHTYL